MNPFTRRSPAIALAALLLIGVAGCASAPPTADSLPPVPVGTTATFSRESSGSYGSQKGLVTWTYGEASWNGQRVLYARADVGGGTYHDPQTFGIVATIDPAGQPLLSFAPPLALEFPVVVGKSWTSKHVVTRHPAGQQIAYESRWTVEAHERVTVPAGTFMAYRVVRVGGDGEVETRWMGTQPGVPLVRRVLERPTTHPQGAGRQEGQLTSYRVGGG